MLDVNPLREYAARIVQDLATAFVDFTNDDHMALIGRHHPADVQAVIENMLNELETLQMSAAIAANVIGCDDAALVSAPLVPRPHDDSWRAEDALDEFGQETLTRPAFDVRAMIDALDESAPDSLPTDW
jgi:hypothetical protein